MYSVAATELKVNFKAYAKMASSGTPVLINRPKKEKNLVLINEEQYRRTQRLMEYFARLNGFSNVEELYNRENEILNITYNDDFLSILGTLDEDALVRPEQGTNDMDSFREVL